MIEAFERHGGTMLHIHPDENVSSTEAALRKADMAIVSLNHMNHKKSQEIFGYCKQMDIPCDSIKHSGTTGILMKAKTMRVKV